MHRPRSDPKFHKIEMLTGAGRSVNAPLKTLSSGCVVRIGLNMLFGKCSKWAFRNR